MQVDTEDGVAAPWTAPGFERVAEVFTTSAFDLGAGGGAFAVYVDGEKVVDLWGGDARPGVPWAADTTTVLFSATKAVVAFAALLLHDRGLLDLDAPVARYWPEFAANGKEEVPVRDLLSHRAGVVVLPGYLDLLGRDGQGWGRYDDIVAALASAAPAWPPGERHGYHVVTWGWLVGELVRRIDGRRLGPFVDEEIAVPLGLDLRIGTPRHEHARLATVIPPDPGPPEVPQLRALWEQWTDPTTVPGQAFLAGPDGGALDHMGTTLASPEYLEAEVGSGNGTGTARSVARLAAVLAESGVLDGTRVVDASSVAAFRKEHSRGVDAVLGLETRWAVGFMLQTPLFSLGGLPSPFGPNPEAFGHTGHGGQVVVADPERHVAAAFVRSRMTEGFLFPGVLLDSVYGCLS